MIRNSWEGAFGSQPDIRENNVVISVAHKRPFTLPHEIQHILLNSAHDGSPAQMLFYSPTSSTNTVNSTKRINSTKANTMRGSKFVD